MPDDSLHQPHDKLFRATFPDPTNAAAFLRNLLSGTFPSHVDWDSIRSIPGTFIDPGMNGLEADFLFSAKVGGTDTLFYIRGIIRNRPNFTEGRRLFSRRK